MSWANIKELLLQERKTLDLAAVPNLPQENAFETRHSALLACYLRTKSAVDAAVSTFAHTLDWPEMTPLVRFFVIARLDFAWEIASILNTTRGGDPLIAYPCPETSTTAELLEWLLIDVWPYGCSRFLQAQKWAAEQAPSPPASVMDASGARAKCVA